LRALSDEARRLNLEIPTQSADLCLPLPFDLHSRFDRVLVDAPCSGVGTLRRRPEIARRLAPEDPARLGQLQLQIAKNAALALRPGGVLLFATCSVFSEEGEEVVAQLCDEGGLKPTDLSTVVELFARTGLAPDQARSTSVRLLPGLHGTDGYFLARLRRV
jgi:16S rRNA (cytosine967-C5)-methyltransferase